MKHLQGFGLHWYRSFHSDMQFLAPMGQVTLLAGQNNVGKSNIIRFAKQVLGPLGSQDGASATSLARNTLDIPQGLGEPTGIEFAIPYGTIEDVVSAIREITDPGLHESFFQEFENIFSAPNFQLIPGTRLVWLRFAQILPHPDQNPITFTLSQAQMEGFVNSPNGNRSAQFIQQVSSTLTGHRSSVAQDLTSIIAKLDPFRFIPPVEVVEAFRQVRSATGDELVNGAYSGQNLISKLAELQNPDINARDNRERFEAINRFVRNVLGDHSATLDIPHHQKEIYVSHGGVTLPLANLGTGVEQVVILAAAATLLQETLVCIEEPEIHLHPLLQRKLLQYLAIETSNQYLIATHSAHMLDAELATIFHVVRTDRGTQIRHASNPKDRAAICADLGYRPSDLVQANAVIWVEGPSDRIYIRHWLSLIDSVLTEGIHYSLMFYGGRLLNHLTANDPDVQEFISLRRLNRHIAIVIDSDKTSQQKKISATKKRVRDEFDQGPGFAWVTKGYTIENYIPPDLLRAAVEICHPKGRLKWTGLPHSNPFSESNYIGVPAQADKVAVSREVVSQWTEITDWPYDLRQQIRRCADFIREANGLNKRDFQS